jgi:hypothetical protein
MSPVAVTYFLSPLSHARCFICRTCILRTCAIQASSRYKYRTRAHSGWDSVSRCEAFLTLKAVVAGPQAIPHSSADGLILGHVVYCVTS